MKERLIVPIKFNSLLRSSLLLIPLLSTPAYAQFTFNNIVDTNTFSPSGGNFSVFYLPSIDGNKVVYKASTTIGSGIYTGSIGVTEASLIVDTNSASPSGGNFSSLGDFPMISGNTVAFKGNYSLGEGIYTGTVGVTGASRIVDRTTLVPGGGGTVNSVTDPVISGTNLAFQANGSTGIYSGTVGTPGMVKIADSTTIVPAGTIYQLGKPAISNNTLAFAANAYNATTNTITSGIYTGVVGVAGVSPIITTINSTSYGQVSLGGTDIVFTGYNSFNVPSIYAAKVGVSGALKIVEDFVTVVPGTTPTTVFQTLGWASVSGGKVAFAGEWSGRTQAGIFLRSSTAAGGTLQKVIRTGDSLFGSTITAVHTEGSQFFSNDTIAFRYILANGVQGIATASVVGTSAPEPGTLVLLSLGGTLVLIRRRQRLGA